MVVIKVNIHSRAFQVWGTEVIREAKDKISSQTSIMEKFSLIQKKNVLFFEEISYSSSC